MTTDVFRTKKKSVEETAQEVLAEIDDCGAPSQMTKEQWRDFLQILINDLQVRLEAVVEELNE